MEREEREKERRGEGEEGKGGMGREEENMSERMGEVVPGPFIST